MLLALPIFWAIDKLAVDSLGTQEERDQNRLRYKARRLKLLSFIFQVIPFLLLCLVAANYLMDSGVSLIHRQWVMAICLFGNTAALMMNTYYGHGLTAVFCLAMYLSLLHRRFWIAGFCAGSALLCDYGFSLVLVTIVSALVFHEPKERVLTFLLGGLIPGVLWAWYHHAAFGSIFSIANQYQNPIFVDVAGKGPNLWGILTLMPDIGVLIRLLIGEDRGLLPTQSWVFIAVVSCAWIKRPYALTLSIGLGLLLWMNASFGGWHGGLTPGPRYLCAIVPSMAIYLGLALPRFPSWLKTVTKASIAASVVFTALAFATNIAPPLTPLWPYYLEHAALHGNASSISRLLWMALGFGFLILRNISKGKAFAGKSQS